MAQHEETMTSESMVAVEEGLNIEPQSVTIVYRSGAIQTISLKNSNLPEVLRKNFGKYLSSNRKNDFILLGGKNAITVLLSEVASMYLTVGNQTDSDA